MYDFIQDLSLCDFSQFLRKNFVCLVTEENEAVGLVVVVPVGERDGRRRTEQTEKPDWLGNSFIWSVILTKGPAKGLRAGWWSIGRRVRIIPIISMRRCFIVSRDAGVDDRVAKRRKKQLADR